jgi:hypothetical protein
MRHAPVVKLYRNPWSATLGDGVVLQILQTAATNAYGRLQNMIVNDEVESGRDSFGMVLLDPTRPRSAVTFADRVFAVIELGPNGASYVPNGAAKADAHDRHGKPNGLLVEEFSFALGDGDFAWGHSASYGPAIGGGSGLSQEQDRNMTYDTLKEVMSRVHVQRSKFLAEQRRGGQSHGWYNPGNEPGADYAAILDQVPCRSPVSA